MSEQTEISGAFVDLDDGTRLEWSFNPEGFTDSDSANFAKIAIPGMSHPRIQFTGGGERTLAFVLPLHYSRTDVPKDIRTLRGWLYAKYVEGKLKKAPHRLLVQFGDTWQGEKWRMESCEVGYKRFDKDGKAIFALVSILLFEHPDSSRSIEEVRG